MKETKKLLALLLLLGCGVALLCGCVVSRGEPLPESTGEIPSASTAPQSREALLVGRWEIDQKRSDLAYFSSITDEDADFGKAYYLFREDGTGETGSVFGESTAIEWRLEGNTLCLSTEGEEDALPEVNLEELEDGAFAVLIGGEWLWLRRVS